MLATTQVLPPRGLNTAWYLDLNDIARHSAWAHGVLHAYAAWGGLLLLAALVVVAWAQARLRPSSHRALTVPLLTALAALVAVVLNQLLIHGAGELRPYAAHPGALVLVGKGTDFSFPSDHAAAAGALALGLLLHDRRIGIVGLVLALLLAFSRVYVGAHYPGDVVAGLLVGAAVGAAVAFGLRPVARRILVRLSRLRIGALLVGD